MNFSPTVRTVLIVVAVVAGTLTGVGAALGVPAVVISIAGALTAALAGLGIVPPQVGGTQQGVVNPSVATPLYIDPATGAATTEQPHKGARPIEPVFDVESEPVIERYAPRSPL